MPQTITHELAFKVLAPAGGAVRRLARDPVTRGSWVGTYGRDGQMIAGLAPALPAGVTATLSVEALTWVGQEHATHPSALSRPGAPDDRILAQWYAGYADSPRDPGPFRLDLAFPDDAPRRVALYFYSTHGPEPANRHMMVQGIDPATGAALTTDYLDDDDGEFMAGVWLVYEVVRACRFTFTRTGIQQRPILNGVLFGPGGDIDPPPPPPPPPPPDGAIGTAQVTADRSDHVVTFGAAVTVTAGVAGASEVWVNAPTGRIDLPAAGGTFSFTPQVSGPFPLFAKDAAGAVVVKPMSVIVRRARPAIDPTAPPTLATVRDGPLDDPSTWGGRLPTPDEVVEVRHACDYSGRAFWCGHLISRCRVTVRGGVLHTSGLHVPPGGALALDGRGVDKSLAMLHNRATPLDVLIDGDLIIQGNPASRCRFAAGAIKAGDTAIRLTEPAEGWAVGHKLLLHDTRKLSTQAATQRQEEIVVVRGVTDGGRTVHLLDPARFDHLPVVDADGAVPFRVRVLHLIANAGFVTSDPTDVPTRACVTISGTGRVFMDHWLVHGTGRFKAGVGMDLALQDKNPLGLHNLIGQDNVGPNGERFVVTNGVSLDPPPVVPIGGSQVSWGIALNNSHKGLVEGNVSFNWHGASIVLLSGNERWNKVRGNFSVALNEANHSELNSGTFDVGHTSAGIWSRGPMSDIDGNFASGCYRGYVVAPYMHPNHANVKAPAYPGADPRLAGQSEAVNLRNLPLSSFDGNVAFGAVVDGLEIWALGVDRHGTSPAPGQAESRVTNFRAARCRDLIYYNYMTSRVTFADTVGRDGGNGFFSSDYLADQFRLVRADLRGFMTAWTAGPLGDQSHEDCYLEAFTGIDVGLLWASGWDARNIPPRTIAGKNLRWAPPANANTFPAWWGPPAAIRTNGQPTWGPGASNAWSLVAANVITVSGFQGDPADAFRVYYPEQARTAPFQQSELFPKSPTPSNPNPPDQYRVWACPESGLTNEEAWVKHGLAWGGALLPGGAATRAGIVGLVAPL